MKIRDYIRRVQQKQIRERESRLKYVPYRPSEIGTSFRRSR